MKSHNPEDLPLRERSIPEVSNVLQGALGQRLVAYAIGERNPKRIGQLARGEDAPSPVEEVTLRDLAEVTETLANKGCSDAMTRSLLLGMNPSFDDEAPIQLFHQGDSARVVAAAPGFLEGYH